MGIASAFSVIAAVLVAIIIMPAIFGVLGERFSYNKQNRFLKLFSRSSKKKVRKADGGDLLLNALG